MTRRESAESRFDRHTNLPGWNQARLEQATAVIAGVGALGNHVAQCLALAGVGHLVLCDPDVVATSNLSRTPLFREKHVGRRKVDAAAESLADLAPEVRVSPRARRLENGVGLAEIRDASIVLGCLDSVAARLELAGRCGLVGAPWIDGATGPWSGEVRLYLDQEGPCYGCHQDPADRAKTDAPLSCAAVIPEVPAGATAPLSATIAAQMSLLAVRHLLALEVPRGLLALDAQIGTVSPVRLERNAGCPFHSRLPQAMTIDVSHGSTVGELLRTLGPRTQPLAWSAFQLRSECPRCGQVIEQVGPIEERSCPSCGAIMHARTSLELSLAPLDVSLEAVGVAPREILAFRRDGQGLGFAELIA